MEAMQLGLMVLVIVVIFIIGMLIMVAKLYRKVSQGEALVKTGLGGVKVTFNGMMVIPVIHRAEVMDISVKAMEISRLGKDGLICKDNLRADIKVVFFVRVNKSMEDVINVAQTIGTERASDIQTLNNLFEAKFSEALKTVGKTFNFVDLYEEREEFRKKIFQMSAQDLNGYTLDNCSIDYLEQTPLEFLKPDNILDSEGIKKIVELTAEQNMKANFVRKEEEKTIKRQNVEAQEAILELDRQLAEKQERQLREIANIKAREGAEIMKVNEEERLKGEHVRITTDEALEIAEENKMRSVIVAQKSKERTEAVENERVEKDMLLERTEKEKIVALAEIEKEKAIEEERKNIQDVIRERVSVEKKVVEELEKTKDVQAIATAQRAKDVAILQAEEEGESTVILQTKRAEAAKLSAEIEAEKLIIDAEAEKNAAIRQAEARKIAAEAQAAEEATIGLSEAQVTEAKALAKEKEGKIDASLIEMKMKAEAEGMKFKADALLDQGKVEAEVMELKAMAEAKGVAEKALAMQKLDGVGKDHEEFKLQLEMEKEVALAQMNVDKDIADAKAEIIGQALKSAKIDIVGGEGAFFEKISGAVASGKSVDMMLSSSEALTELKDALLGDNGNNGILSRVRETLTGASINLDDVKNLSIIATLFQIQQNMAGDDNGSIGKIIESVRKLGIGSRSTSSFL
ncbi:MAG: flotillin [Saprospiraceae bacterium]|jgi:flotillin